MEFYLLQQLNQYIELLVIHKERRRDLETEVEGRTARVELLDIEGCQEVKMTGKVCSPAGERHTDVVSKELSCHPTGLQLRRDSAGILGQKNGGLLKCLTNEETEAWFK